MIPAVLLLAYLIEFSILAIRPYDRGVWIAENIPPATVEFVAKSVPSHPSAHVLATCQNRRREKEFLRAAGIPCANFAVVTSLAELQAAGLDLTLARDVAQSLPKTMRRGLTSLGLRKTLASQLAPLVVTEDEHDTIAWIITEAHGHPIYYAWGFGGQYIFVVPDLDLVVVTTSSVALGNDRREYRAELFEIVESLIVEKIAG